MAFEIGKTLNSGAEWLCGSALIFKTLSNPFFAALLITTLALIIVYGVYKDVIKGTGWRRGLKTGIWMAIGVSALVFIHYYALERFLRKDRASQGVRDVMASIHHSATTGGGYSVYTTPPLESGIENPPRAYGRPDNVGVPDSEFTKVDPSSHELDELDLQPAILSSTLGLHE
ncbi:hypothetical protein ElyMa_002510000 [Elysia marginata]|uniref:Uncharacterized protein n=1 Tax=Elysia marginata TaxID=1093978 RepID=A0AAV4GTN4_9GAST|nr:hypothetical protein ElyMa_002510000 [Elysia marginata]